MRREEILKLTWDEVDLSGSVGMIRLSSERTKGKKQGRAIPLHPRMREILEQLRKRIVENEFSSDTENPSMNARILSKKPNRRH